jgi:hypothetical protein
MSPNDLTIRATIPADTDDLARLDTIGSRPYMPGSDGLVAELDGTPVAAISLSSGAVGADLDRADAGTVGSLRYRRYQILRQGGDVGRARNVLRRLAPPCGMPGRGRR